MDLKTVYFEHPGSGNTEATLQVAKHRAQELGVKNIIVASTTGATAVRAMDIFEGLRVIVVTHVTGLHDPNVQEFTEKNHQIVESKGGRILTATHAFGGLSRAIRKKYNTYVLGEVISDVLRIFGQGTKVACEIALMAADSGLVSTEEDVITITGSNVGADTAIVLRPVNTHDFFDLKIKEILCKPHF